MADRTRREELKTADLINAAVSRMTGQVEAIALESNWTEEQRLAIRIVAGRLGQRTFGTFKADQAKAEARFAAAEMVRQIAARIVTIEAATPKGSAPKLLIDDQMAAAARLIVMD